MAGGRWIRTVVIEPPTRWPRSQEDDMPYVHITVTPGQTMESYQRVSDSLGELGLSDGNLAHLVAADDDGLHVVDVWESKAHADRFEAARLFPAFAAAGLGPDEMAGTQIKAFDSAIGGINR
jgi:hypothetical protein